MQLKEDVYLEALQRIGKSELTSKTEKVQIERGEKNMENYSIQDNTWKEQTDKQWRLGSEKRKNFYILTNTFIF